MKWKSEAQFQSECFKWFDRSYPGQRGRLIMIYNNPPNAIVGSMLVSMGLKKGASDLLYFAGHLKLIFIELKVNGGHQTDDQFVFQVMVESLGFTYELIESSEFTNIDTFKNLIKTLNHGR